MSLSRIQLAAALREYDNDPQDRTRPNVSHRDSAIFLQFQKPYRPLDTDLPVREQNHRASLPRPRQSSAYSHRDSRSVHLEEQETLKPEDEDQVDLSRWDLPSHLLSPESSHTGQLNDTPIPRLASGGPKTMDKLSPKTVSASLSVSDALGGLGLHERAKSVYVDVLDGEGPMYDMTSRASISDDQRRRSSNDWYEVSARSRENSLPMDSRRRTQSILSSVHIDTHTRRPSNPLMIPLPNSPLSTTHPRPYSSLSSHLVNSPSASTALRGQDEMDGDVESLELPNPFALPPPPLEMGSRFDPKTLAAQRRPSMDSVHQTVLNSRPPTRIDTNIPTSPHRTVDYTLTSPLEALSRSPNLHPVADNRPTSIPFPLRTEGRVYDELPTPDEYARPLIPPKYNASTVRIPRTKLLRPKTLIMPTPLSGSEYQPEEKVRDGFMLGEKPLPAAARSSILSLGGRPGLPMSLSQKTFRDSLVVGEHGELGDLGIGEDAGEEVEEEVVEDRRPGKLYGTSLIDQLEARKQAMKGKQRVFTGDARPAMMARPGARTSTLIDPSTLSDPPQLPPDPTARSPTKLSPASPKGPHNRRLSVGPTYDRMANSRSVFGVDQLWEREMNKLAIIKEREQKIQEEAEERERIKAEKAKRKKDKGKGKARDDLELQVISHQSPAGPADLSPSKVDSPSSMSISPIKKIPDSAPTLQFSPEKIPPLPLSATVTEFSKPTKRSGSRLGVTGWFGSSDESSDDGMGHRLKQRPKGKGRAVSAPAGMPDASADSDDEDDEIPLSKLPTGNRQASISGRKPQISYSDSSDEDVPLSKIAKSPAGSRKGTLPVLGGGMGMMGTGSLGLVIPGLEGGDTSSGPISGPGAGDDDDDDIPLLLRQSRAKAIPSPAQGADDDIPLGLRASTSMVYHQQQQYNQHQPYLQMQMQPPMMPGWPNPQYQYGGMNGYPSLNGYPSFQHMMSGYPSIPMMNPGYPTGMPPPNGLANYQYQPAGLGFPLGPGQGPEVNIDNWRKEVPLEPVATGSGGSRSGNGVR